jgi:hypothetical protein
MTTRQKLEEAALVLENEGAFYRQLCDLYKSSDALPGTARVMINNHAIKAGFKGLTEPDAESLRLYFEEHWSLKTCLPSSLGPSHNLLKPEPAAPKDPTSPYKHWLKTLLDIPTFKVEFLDRPKPRNARDFMSTRLRDMPNCATNASQRETLRLWLCNHFGVKTQPDTNISPALDWESILLDPPAAQPQQPQPQQPQPQENTTMSLKLNAQQPFELNTKTYLNGVDLDSLSNSELYAQIQAQEDAIEKLQAIKAKPKSLLAEIKKRQAGIEALVAYLDSKNDGR